MRKLHVGTSPYSLQSEDPSDFQALETVISMHTVRDSPIPSFISPLLPLD